MQEMLSYEQLTRSIEAGIAKLNEVTTITCQRDADVQGRLDTHRVDLYWEFTDGDITYKTVIQTRSWEKTANNSELFKFVSVLRDIPGQTTGVLFSQPVYQKDTKQLAKDAGVLLFELSMEAAAPRREAVVHNPNIQVDLDWTKAEKTRLGLEDETFQFSGDPKYLFLYDEGHNCIDSIHGVISDYLKSKSGASEQRATVHHYFEKPTFLQTDSEAIPFVKLTSLMFEIEYVDPNESMGDDIAQAILAHVLRYYSR